MVVVGGRVVVIVGTVVVDGMVVVGAVVVGAVVVGGCGADDVVVGGGAVVGPGAEVDVTTVEAGESAPLGLVEVVVGAGSVIAVVTPMSSVTVPVTRPSDVVVVESDNGTRSSSPSDGSGSLPWTAVLSASTLADSTSGSTSSVPFISHVAPTRAAPTTATVTTARTGLEIRRPTRTLSRHEERGCVGGAVSESRRAICLASSSGLKSCRRLRGGKWKSFLPVPRAQAEVTNPQPPCQRSALFTCHQ